MSHFTVLVVLPKDTELEGIDAKLEEVLAPWNENTEVEAYRSYEEGTPEEHWGYDSSTEKMLPATEGAAVTPMTWAQYVPLFNARWAVESEGGERLFLDEETDRAYTMTTYNPLSKWDWWSVGGRWANSLIAKPTVDASALRFTTQHWTEEHGNVIPKGRGESGGIQCDAGRLCDIDLEAMRIDAIAKATAEYDDYARTIGEHIGTTKPWSHFNGLVLAGHYDERARAGVVPNPLDPDQPIEQHEVMHAARDLARAEYNNQPGIVALRQQETYRYMFACPVMKFALGREEYIKAAGAQFLPGYAMVTLDGEWLAQGEMGWWGMGSDTAGTKEAFKLEAYAYLRDQVDQESIVVLVDCHI